MKCITFGILLIFYFVDFGASEEESRTSILWNAWKRTYGKRYLSSAEEKQRRKNFQARIQLMDAVNDKYAKGELPFNLTIYEYADTTREEFVKLRTGLRIPSELDAPKAVEKRTKREPKVVRRPSYPRQPRPPKPLQPAPVFTVGPVYTEAPTTTSSSTPTTTIQPISEGTSSTAIPNLTETIPFFLPNGVPNLISTTASETTPTTTSETISTTTPETTTSTTTPETTTSTTTPETTTSTTTPETSTSTTTSSTTSSTATTSTASNPSDINNSPQSTLIGGQVTAPASVNWVTAGKVTSVKDQGSCGSCWAFSALAAMESQYLIRSGTTFNLAEQQLVSCDKSSYGCNGGWPYNTMDNYLKFTGVTTEDKYPYKGTKTTCSLKSSWIRYKDAGQTQPITLNGDEAKLMELVASRGPVVVAIYASDLFQQYSNGILIDNTCNNPVNHGVVVVGYGTENGVDYWLVKNSWGSSWGENGYIRMARNRNNQCRIASYGSVPLLP